jgi:hypothetical protein
MSDAANDDPAPPGSAPEPHGEAALLLVESLIHGLLARSSLSLPDALDIVQTAIDVQIEISDHRGGDPIILPTSVRLLSAIAQSLGLDAEGKNPQNLDPDESGGGNHD